MGNINWKIAPEGATHGRFVRHDPGNDPVIDFYRLDGKIFEYWNRKNNIWRLAVSDIKDCVQRPVEPSWDGIGFPPIGIDFEWRYGDHAWKTGRALYIGSVYAILVANDGEQHYYLRDMQFRPIRTPEQIAADERLHQVRNALSAIHAGQQKFPNDLVRGNIVAATVEAMIDAGYRKFEITDDNDPA